MFYVRLYFTRFTQALPEDLWTNYIKLLPEELSDKNSGYLRWQDRHSHLLGKLLLIEGLNYYGYGQKALAGLQYNKYGRPYLYGAVDFNISHSGEYVLCAVGSGLRLGVDIEKVKGIDFNDFKKVMTRDQWEDIHGSSHPTRSFFNYWTIKESVIKADSRGLSIPLLDLHVANNKVSYDHQIWHLHELTIDKDYSACLASEVEDVEISFEYVDFYEYGTRDAETGKRKTGDVE